MRNIEIKARIEDVDKTVLKAEELGGGCKAVYVQRDTYYDARKGRLKMRTVMNKNAELISYDRPNVLGPKLSTYNKLRFDDDNDAECMAEILTQSLGKLGTVVKKRQKYMIGQTRIHIDEVEDLGNFMELEVVLGEHEEEKDGHKIAADLIQAFQIKEEDLIAKSYIDLLTTTKRFKE